MDPNTISNAPPRNKGGRPIGSKGRRKPFEKEPLPEKKRQMFWGCYTVAQWQDKFKSLPPDKQFDILARLEPKDVNMKATGESTFHLVINGLGLGQRAIQADYVPAVALPTYVVDTTTELTRIRSLPSDRTPPPSSVPEYEPDERVQREMQREHERIEDAAERSERNNDTGVM
jgi:hypothetical protein